MLPFYAIFFVLIIIAVAIIAQRKMNLAAKQVAPADEDQEAKDVDVTGYRMKRFLFSPAEYSFYKVLLLALGNRYSIMVKVRIADIVEVDRAAAKRQGKFNRIAKKHADFVLCDPKSMVVQAVIELDDASHKEDDRQERDALVDAIYREVGLPCVHVAAARDYQPQDVVRQVDAALAAVPKAPGHG